MSVVNVPPHRHGQAALMTRKCPYCGDRMQLRELTHFPSALGVVPVAWVNVCLGCGGEVVTEQEWERWKRMLR